MWRPSVSSTLFGGTLLGVVLMTTAVLTVPAPAQSLRHDTSLKFVPAESSFYVSLLHNREQVERLLQSKAFAKFHSLPFVQRIWAELHDDDKWQAVEAFFAQPENQRLLDALGDAASQEIFLFGDERCADWFSALSQLSNTINLAQLKAATTGQRPEEVIQAEMMALLTGNTALYQVPSIVMGFRVTDKDAVQHQIERLEVLLKDVIAREAPQLQDRLTRQSIGDQQFLTLSLDGSLIPWDEVLEDADLPADGKEQLKQRLTQIKLTISLGVWNNYLLIAKGETTQQLADLGQQDLLADRPELAPLWKAEAQRISSIGYASARFMERITAIQQQVDQLTTMGKTALPLLPIEESIKTDLAADLDALGQQLKDAAPRMGAVMGYEFLTDEGYESLSYNWGEQKSLDGSQPLTILNHLGGTPIGFFATRTKPQPEIYEFARTWSNKLAGHLERAGRPLLKPEQQELYDRIKAELVPLLARLDQANREKLAPAMADGQSAIVLDAQATATQWCNFMQTADQPLPLPQLALVYGVSNAQLLKEGAAEYMDVLQTAMGKMAELMPGRVPSVEIPRPTPQEVPSGTVYRYAMPAVAGVDPRIAPNAGVSADTLAVCLLPETTQRLLASQRLEGPGPLANLDRPLASAWHFSLRQLVQAARPWVDYAVKVGSERESVDEEIVSQVRSVLDLLACFRDASGVSYFEDGALVSHSQMRLSDLE